MNKKILIFGYTGGIGSELIKILKNKKYDLILLNKKKLNFNSNNANKKIHKILKIYNPDIIINAAGILGSNKDDYTKIYNINLMPNWEVVKYYKKTKFIKKIILIILGSSSYKSGRKNYILYASSKAALNNLCQGSKEFLRNKNIKIKLLNFGKVYTPMIKKYVRQNMPNVISPRLAAQKICRIFDKEFD